MEGKGGGEKGKPRSQGRILNVFMLQVDKVCFVNEHYFHMSSCVLAILQCFRIVCDLYLDFSLIVYKYIYQCSNMMWRSGGIREEQTSTV